MGIRLPSVTRCRCRMNHSEAMCGSDVEAAAPSGAAPE